MPGPICSFRPPSRRRVHEEIAEQLRDAILDGRLEPGQKLPPERELAERFQVNRTSLRQAIKVLEGLGLVVVRQGDGATVLPPAEASLDLLAPMIYRAGTLDTEVLLAATEVIKPLLLEMSRLAIERHRPEQLEEIRRLRDVIADASRQREERFEAGREVIVLLSDMTRNRVWQMLARQTRNLLASRPLREARREMDRDPGEVVPCIDRCVDAIAAGRADVALAALRQFVDYLGELALSLDENRPDPTGLRSAAGS
ncbi:MAG TPA: FadR family transcriptional regulator [Chromatiales bacterium]|nr:FadR family transcriptional regulator [Chromatiales bacterium]